MDFEKIKEVIEEALDINAKELTLDTSLIKDLGVDSLDLFQIITGIEEKFDIEISDEDLRSIDTIKDVLEKIKNTKK